MLFALFVDPQRSESLICFASQMHWNPTGTLFPNRQAYCLSVRQAPRQAVDLLRKSHAEHLPDTFSLRILLYKSHARYVFFWCTILFTLGTYDMVATYEVSEQDTIKAGNIQTYGGSISPYFSICSECWGETSGRKAVATAMIWSCQVGHTLGRPNLVRQSYTELLLKSLKYA